MNSRCKFGHRRSIPRSRFPIRVQNFGDLATFSVFRILYSECPPYFYFRFVWPTDLESIPHVSASTRMLIIPTKFEVGMCIHCRFIAFLSADTSRDLVTLTFDLLTWTVAVHGGSRDQPCHQVRRPHAYPFLIYYRAMLCIRGTSHGPVSVRRSSDTSRCSTKTVKRRITQITPHDSLETLVFGCQRFPPNSTGVTPCGGAKYRWGGSKSATFDK